MGQSGSCLEHLAVAGGVVRRVTPDLVVAFSFYDGPETGIAFFSSGEGLRFSVVAESRLRLFRAFTLTLLDGNWAAIINEVSATSPRMVFSNNTATSALMASISEANEKCCFLAVGDAYLEVLAITAIAKTELEALLDANPHGEYDAIHCHIKKIERGGRISAA